MNSTTTHETKVNKLQLGRNDPILQELWEVKARLNAEAGYRVEAIIERAKRYDHAKALAALGIKEEVQPNPPS